MPEPSGAQSRRALRRRRLAFAGALAVLVLALWIWLWRVLAPGGVSALDGAVLALGLPVFAWLGFWFLNAAIALALLALGKRGAAVVSPYAPNSATDSDTVEPPPTVLAMTLRNEDAARAFRRLIAMRESLDATGLGARFDIAILSDSDRPEPIAEEARLFERLEARLAGDGGAFYRRRETNAGFKAGNLQDFAARDAGAHELMLVLDADSAMDGATILRLARIMARRPRIAVLQSLILPAPGRSAFTRLLRFWARASVRSHYLGQAFWQADAGAFGGHNALVRLQPLREHGHLPEIDAPSPLGGAVLGHDHAEAMLIHGAGWEVRLLPEICGSWEDHPLTAADHVARDRRWRRGVMQYPYLLAHPGLNGAGRRHLAHLVALELAPAAMALLAPLLALQLLTGGGDPAMAGGLWLTCLGLALAPKLVAHMDVLSHAELRRGFGGATLFLASAALDLLFALMLAPLLAFEALAGLLGLAFARLAGGDGFAWTSPPRDETGLSWRAAAKCFWAPTAYGAALTALIVAASPNALIWAVPALLGLVLSIPFAVVTASTRLGARLRRAGLLLIPEETDPPPLLDAIDRET